METQQKKKKKMVEKKQTNKSHVQPVICHNISLGFAVLVLQQLRRRTGHLLTSAQVFKLNLKKKKENKTKSGTEAEFKNRPSSCRIILHGQER